MVTIGSSWENSYASHGWCLTYNHHSLIIPTYQVPISHKAAWQHMFLACQHGPAHVPVLSTWSLIGYHGEIFTGTTNCFSQVSYLTIYFSFFTLISLVPIYLRRTQKACFGFWGVWGTGYAPLALGYYGFNKV